MIAVFCACRVFRQEHSSKGTVNYHIHFDEKLRGKLINLLNSEVCSVYYGLSNKYSIVLQGTFSENNSSVSSLKLERIPSGWIYMLLFTIYYWTEIPFAPVVQTLSINPPTFVVIPQKTLSAISWFFFLFLPALSSMIATWASQTFLVETLLTKKKIGKKPPKLKSKKHSCKVSVFIRKISPGQKA